MKYFEKYFIGKAVKVVLHAKDEVGESVAVAGKLIHTDENGIYLGDSYEQPYMYIQKNDIMFTEIMTDEEIYEALMDIESDDNDDGGEMLN